MKDPYQQNEEICYGLGLLVQFTSVSAHLGYNVLTEVHVLHVSCGQIAVAGALCRTNIAIHESECFSRDLQFPENGRPLAMSVS